MNVSAVVPVYNSINTLERAIKSLLIQSEINEIFIVDDGSTDGSFPLELELESKSPIIKVLTHPNKINRGASASRNLGLMHCSNELIQFLDADDELLPNKIKIQTSLINDKNSILIGNCYLFTKKGKFKRSFIKDSFSGLLIGGLGDTCSNLWKKSVIKEVGLWNEELINTQEYELMFRILKHNNSVAFCGFYLTNIFQNSDSISFSPINSFQKNENHILLKNSIRDYLISTKSFSFINYYYYSSGILNFKRFHKTEAKTYESRFLYIIYKIIKSFKDRYYIYFTNEE